MDETPQRVLVVIPHPDNAEFWCGGTVARWVKDGSQVHFVLCTDGGKGTSDPEISADELGSLREKQQQESGKILGVQEVVLLHHSDGELEDTREFRREIVRQIRRVKPEVVMCPEPYRKNLAWHRDHRVTGQVTLDAVFPYARDHLHFEELWRDEGLEPHKTGTVLFWGTEQADTFLDINDTVGAKTKALLCHQSQMSRSHEELEQFVRECAEAAGADQGYRYAESFRKINFRT